MKCKSHIKQMSGLKSAHSKIAYRQNFVKTKKLILFGPKCSDLGIWARNFRKQRSDLQSAPSKEGTGNVLLRLES